LDGPPGKEFQRLSIWVWSVLWSNKTSFTSSIYPKVLEFSQYDSRRLRRNWSFDLSFQIILSLERLDSRNNGPIALTQDLGNQENRINEFL